METHIFYVKDELTGEVYQPFFVSTIAGAIRAFDAQVVREKDNPSTPDLVLYHAGVFKDGVIDSKSTVASTAYSTIAKLLEEVKNEKAKQ